MSAITATFRRPASHSRPKNGQNCPRKRPLARGLTPPASRVGIRYHSPSEVAGLLVEQTGIPTTARTIQRRCRLPVGDPRRIETHPAHPGRDWIPDTELARLLGGKAAA